MTDVEKAKRNHEAREYSKSVRERRKIRATWALTVIEVFLLVLSIMLAVDVVRG